MDPRTLLRRAAALLAGTALVIGVTSPVADASRLPSAPRPAVETPHTPHTPDGTGPDASSADAGAQDGDGRLAGAAELTAGLPLDSSEFGAGSPDTLADTPAGTSADPAGVADEVRAAVEADGSAAVIVRLREQVDMADLAQRADVAASDAAADARRRLTADDSRSTADVDAAVAEKARTARTATVVDELQTTAERTQGDVLSLLRDRADDGGVSGITPFWIVNQIAATVDAATLDALANHPDVASVALDHEFALPEPIEPDDGEPLLPTWSLEKVRAPQVWGEYGDRGEDVVVGIMDSGADGGHPALVDAWRGTGGDPTESWYVPTGENYPTPGDGHGHGTHVTGSIVGDAPGELTGVAPDAQWIMAKIFRDSGSTSDSIIHDAFQWMLAPGGDPSAAPDVVNNSWGSSAPNDATFWDDVAAWRAAGIVPIFANGNDGPAPGTVGSPGSFPHAIGIGATDANDLIAGFSSRGPVEWDGTTYRKPQVSAPGHLIRSTWPRDLIEEGYHTISGTSMAAPHATGVVALMLSEAPELTVDEVADLLEDTARTEAHMGELPNDAYGAGIVDAYAAVTRAAHSGTVTGTVTGPDGPIAATVTAGDESTTTHPDTGAFELPLREGEHELTVSAYGYVPQTHDVAVVTGETITLDVDLDTATEHDLTGTVTGADGPVAAARVTVTATPLDAVTTDADGRFAVTVAAGTYTLRVGAAGYEPVTREVTVDGATEVEIVLDALDQPSAPGWTQYQNNPARTGLSGDSVAGRTLQPSWTADAGSAVTFASPVIDGGRVLLGSDAGRLTARDITSGERQWVHQFGEALRGTPAVSGGLVYTGGGLAGGIHALDAQTGEQRWSVPTPGRLTVYTAPTVADGVVYAATGPSQDREDTVFALDAATGEQLWATDVGTSVFAGPAVGDGLAIVGNADDGELIALDAATGERRWTLTRQDDYFIGGASLVDGTVHVATTDGNGGGSMLAVDAATGQLRWETDTHGDGQGTTPAVYGDLVIAGSHGLGLVAAYDRGTGDTVWTYAVSGAVSASVLVSNDGFVVGGSQLDNRIWALDAATGELAWDAPTGANVTTSPAYAGGQLVTADTDGTVFAFHPTGTINGTVLGPDGPVEATVRVAETGDHVGTDPGSGTYDLTLPPGEYTVEISSYGLAAHTETVTLTAGAVVTVDADLAPVGDGDVTGVVRDEGGAPVPDVTVSLAGTPVDAVTTGADGTFAFSGVAAGSYRLRAERTGFAPLDQQVTVTAGETTTVELTLGRYDVAVVGDDEGRISTVLERLGYSTQSTDYADVTARAGDFPVVVANGADDTDPGEAAFAEFLAATDAAGTSVVWLDQWSLGWGAINHLIDHVGDPASAPDELGGSGRVSLVATAEHPLTAGLDVGARTPLVTPGSAWSAFQGYSGITVANLETDDTGVAGGGVGYAPRGLDSAHVLLGSLAAAASWGNPDTDWLPAAETVMDNAVRYAADADFGAVEGVVTDESGAAIVAAVEAVGTEHRTTTAADGGYELLLEPGTYTLRISRVGATPLEQQVTVAGGERVTVDAALPDSGAGAVRGTITSNRDGAPIEGADVAVVGTELTAVTAADGTYTVADVPGGTYDLRVSAPGHFTATTSVEVRAGAETTGDVELRAAPRVAVLGDYGSDGVVDLMTAAEISAEEIGWGDVDRVGDFDVVVLNDPDDPGEQAFLDFLAAMDAAQVSGIFPDDRFSSHGGAWLLREYVGDPAADATAVSGEGIVSYAPRDPDHPLFTGLPQQPEILRAGSYATAIEEYSGIPLADTVSEDGGNRGVGAAYAARTPGSVHLLLSGLAATLFQGPAEDWTENGRALYLNAIRWAAAPGLGSATGTVVGAGGLPVAATVEVVGVAGRQVTAEDDGGYVVPLEPGDHTLRFTAFGYKPVERAVTVDAGGTVHVDVQLTPADVGSIAGTVTADVEVGETSALGEPLGEATVSLLGTPLTTTTDADGAYAFDLVEPGSYELEIVADGHVRTRAEVTVEAGEQHVADVVVRPSPAVGVIDDDDDRLSAYLRYWGYTPEPLDWEQTDRVGALDLIVANVGSASGADPGPAGFAAFDDAATRASVSVVWLDQFGRGSFRYLSDYGGDPAVTGQGRDDGAVTVEAAVPDHSLLTGLPASFPLVVDDGEYSWFDEFSGTTVATVSSDTESGRGLAGVRQRGARAADVLLGTLAASYYGYPPVGDAAESSWTPEAERLLRNALGYALDARGLGAEVRGDLTGAAGEPLTGEVTVEETGRTYTARDGDGSFVVPLSPGTWTLRATSFGHESGEITVEVAAGDVVTETIALTPQPTGAVAGVVTGPGGAPVEGARIVLPGTPLQATTDADGAFAVDPVPAGSWTVRVSAPGYQVVEEQVDVADGETVELDVAMTASRPVAVVHDSLSSIQGLLEREGYAVEAFTSSQLADLEGRIGEFELIIVNGSVPSSQREVFGRVVDGAAAAGVSTLYGGQWGGYGIGALSDLRGDPAEVDYSFVPDAVEYVPQAEHPIFAGHEVGEPVEIIAQPGSNQQWLSYSGYSGTTIGGLRSATDGADLGDAVGYAFTSPGSVEILLGSLSASGYGRPGEEWTAAAEDIYLNAVGWAMQARQAELTGVVTGDGEALSGATVTAVEDGATTTTDESGSYTLGLGAGTHTVRVEAFGFETAEQVVEVPESGTASLHVDLVPLPRGGVTGTVTAIGGDPVPGATIEASGPQDWSATTDDAGGFAVDDLIEGAYDVTVTADGYLPGSAEVTVTADGVATLDVSLRPLDVGVLGDVDGALTGFLREADVAAAPLPWDSTEVDRYEVIVVNGGSPDRATFDAVLAAADDARVSLVFTGTWGVDQGGVRLLERYTGRVSVGAQGYGDGPVTVTGFDGSHPLFAGLSDPATIIGDGGYYSALASYAGRPLAQLSVDRAEGDAVTGTAAGYDWRTAGSVEVVLSASAVTGAVGPGLGWTDDGGRLLLNALAWARDAELAAPSVPHVEAPSVTVDSTVQVSGTADWPSTVTVHRDDEPVAEAQTRTDGTWQVKVPVEVGVNELTVAAENAAGASQRSEVVAVSRWSPEWSVEGDGRVRPVELELVGAGAPGDTSAPADSTVLVVRDAGGAEVARHEMRWVAGGHYLHVLSGLAGGEYTLSAEIAVDGLDLEVDGVELTVPGRGR